MLTYATVCSGIEACTVAWHPLGFTPQYFAEIDPFCCALLKHYYPEVPNYGDFTAISAGATHAPVLDILCAGTPCQAFSVAGQRAGLTDPRGNLTLEFLRLASRVRPRWIVWENVPGVLSIDAGKTFAQFLDTLAELGYGYAYRVLDAQYFGVAQRRRRVFVVANLGDWDGPREVLFEPESMRGDIAARRTQGQEIAGTLGGGSGAREWCDDLDRATFVTGTLTANGKAAGSATGQDAYNNSLLTFDGRGITSRQNSTRVEPGRPCPTLNNSHELMIAYGGNNQSGPIQLAAGINAKGGTGRCDFESETFVLPTMQSGSTLPAGHRGISGDTKDAYVVVVPILEAGARTGVSTTDKRAGMGIGVDGDPMYTLQAGKQHAIALSMRGREHGAALESTGNVVSALRASQGGGDKAFVYSPVEIAHTLRADGFDASEDGTGRGSPLVPSPAGVRRLTPMEWERLQGFPDNYTLIPYRKKLAADGPRYRAIGNSMAIPVMQWIGARLAAVDAKQRRVPVPAIEPARRAYSRFYVTP